MRESHRLFERFQQMGVTRFGATLSPDFRGDAELVCKEVNRALDAIEAGDYEEVDLDADAPPQRPWREILADAKAGKPII